MKENEIRIGSVIRINNPYLFEPSLRIIDIKQDWITVNNAEEIKVTTTQSIPTDSLEFYECDRSMYIVHLIRSIFLKLKWKAERRGK